MDNTITLGGVDYKIAPLRSLQVAEFYDAIDAAGDNETKVSMITRSMRTMARSLKNAKDATFVDLTEEDAIAKIDEIAAFGEVDAAFGKVLQVSGLKKTDPGEAPAADESTSNASSAALSASSDGNSSE